MSPEIQALRYLHSLDVEEIAERLQLERRGADDGRAEQPVSGDQSLSETEQAIVDLANRHLKAVHEFSVQRVPQYEEQRRRIDITAVPDAVKGIVDAFENQVDNVVEVAGSDSGERGLEDEGRSGLLAVLRALTVGKRKVGGKEALEDAASEAKDALNRLSYEVRDAVAEHLSLVQGEQRFLTDYKRTVRAVRRDGDDLIDRYRRANRGARSTPEPESFGALAKFEELAELPSEIEEANDRHARLEQLAEALFAEIASAVKKVGGILESGRRSISSHDQGSGHRTADRTMP